VRGGEGEKRKGDLRSHSYYGFPGLWGGNLPKKSIEENIRKMKRKGGGGTVDFPTTHLSKARAGKGGLTSPQRKKEAEKSKTRSLEKRRKREEKPGRGKKFRRFWRTREVPLKKGKGSGSP